MRFVMSRKGDADIKYIIAGVLAIVILVVVMTGVWERFAVFIGVAEYLPGFNQTVPEGTSVVGVNLKTNELRYFTGEKWRLIKESDKNFVMDKFEFAPSKLKSEIEDFYFKTLRRPEKFSIDINHWRYWDVYLDYKIWGGFTIYPKVKKYFESQEQINSLKDYIYIDYTDKESLYPREVVPSFVKAEFEKYPNKIKEVISWRDSILQGNKCEKFISFPGLKENKQIFGNNYTVRKVDDYLFVDLDKPVTSGSVQKWDDEECSKVIYYYDYEDRSNWRNDASVKFSYTIFEGDDHQGQISMWRSNSWTVGENDLTQISLFKNIYYHLRFYDSPNTFYGKLVELMKIRGIFWSLNVEFNVLRADEGVFIAGSKNSVDLGTINGKKWQTLKPDEINKFIYDILTEYYRHFKASSPKVLSFGDEYRASNMVRIKLNNEFTGIYLLNGLIYLEGIIEPIGKIGHGGTIELEERYSDDVNRIFGQGSFELFNTRKITINQIMNGVDLSALLTGRGGLS